MQFQNRTRSNCIRIYLTFVVHAELGLLVAARKLNIHSSLKITKTDNSIHMNSRSMFLCRFSVFLIKLSNININPHELGKLIYPTIND